MRAFSSWRERELLSTLPCCVRAFSIWRERGLLSRCVCGRPPVGVSGGRSLGVQALSLQWLRDARRGLLGTRASGDAARGCRLSGCRQCRGAASCPGPPGNVLRGAEEHAASLYPQNKNSTLREKMREQLRALRN